MALTDTQKASARLYLGYSDRYRDDHQLEDALDNLTDEGETVVGDLLTSLGTIDTTLTSSWSRQKVLRAEEITLAGAGELRALRAEGRRLVRRLAATLGVPVVADAFGGGGSTSGVARRGA